MHIELLYFGLSTTFHRSGTYYYWLNLDIKDMGYVKYDKEYTKMVYHIDTSIN